VQAVLDDRQVLLGRARRDGYFFFLLRPAPARVATDLPAPFAALPAAFAADATFPTALPAAFFAWLALEAADLA
jgi:hypothetical protein